MFGLRGQELIIVLVIVLIIFGARKLPDLARSLGASAKEFRKGIEDGTSEDAADQVSETSNDDPDAPTSDSSEVPDS